MEYRKIQKLKNGTDTNSQLIHESNEIPQTGVSPPGDTSPNPMIIDSITIEIGIKTDNPCKKGSIFVAKYLEDNRYLIVRR